ncbi:MAG: hypothetical protein F2839_07070 [Actinobacteria bacterium]|uniref:Unannotated protein n=1 Tax=freshwater metagenome TaxID=449393 RepID=A0A6J5ZYU1_9ZZZZ|nr:hypothetical protein [Actinomycetota bacterium]
MHVIIKRLIRRSTDERGAAGTIFAVLLGFGVILALATLVVDVGQILTEKRVLQNSADAASLALGQRCAKNLSNCSTSATATNGAAPTIATIVNGNSPDNASKVDTICGYAYRSGSAGSNGLSSCNALTTKDYDCDTNLQSPTFQFARIYTSTKTKSGGGALTMYFAKALSGGATYANGVTVHSCSQVYWGAETSTSEVKLPIAISVCNYLNLGFSSMYPDSSATCTNKRTLSGATVSGTRTGVVGFWCSGVRCPTWTDQSCATSHSMAIGDVLEYVTPTSTKALCTGLTNKIRDALFAQRDQTLTIPVYKDIPSATAGSAVEVVSFARFTLSAFAMNNTLYKGTTYVASDYASWKPNTCINLCIAGKFSSQLSVGGQLDSTGTVPNLGLQVLRLVP